jgi:hypothetical protein
MQIERAKTVIVVEGNEEHRALQIAMAVAVEVMDNAFRDGAVPPVLVRAGANPVNMTDLHDVKDHVDRVRFELGGG